MGKWWVVSDLVSTFHCVLEEPGLLRAESQQLSDDWDQSCLLSAVLAVEKLEGGRKREVV